MLALSLATAGVAAAATTPEFKPVPTKHKFKGTSGTLTLTNENDVYTCPKGTVTGEITGGRNVGNAVMTFTGCTSKDGLSTESCPVNTQGAKSGEIVTEALTGELGTVATTEAPSGVGLRLKPELVKKWWIIEGNKCTGSSAWNGSVAAEVAVIGKKQTTNKLVIRPEIEKIKLDSGVSEGLELEDGFLATFETTTEVTFEEALEVT